MRFWHIRAFILALLLLSGEGLSAHARPRPIVIVPGILGSKLCDGAGHLLWGDRLSYTAGRLQQLQLPADPSKRDPSIHSCGLIDSVNIIPLLWQSDVYSKLIAFLKSQGYDDSDIIQVDYDWRLSNFDSAERLRQRIDQRVPAGQKFDLIAHSMGGLAARVYLQTLGGAERVNSVTFFSTPHLGSAKILQELSEGFDNWPSGLSGGLDAIKETILSFPSTYQLLPTYDECCAFAKTVGGDGAVFVDLLDPSTWKRFSWLPNSLRTGAGADALVQRLAEARRLSSLMKQPVLPGAEEGSRVHYVANGFIDTWSRVFFDPDTGAILGRIVNSGDGDVLLNSATDGVPARFQFSSQEHTLIFASREAELLLRAILAGTNFTKGSVVVTQILIDAKSGQFPVTSAGITTVPRVVMPNADTTFQMTLAGDETLKDADLSNVVCELLQDGKVIGRPAISFSDGPGPSTRVLTSHVTMPAAEGAYVIRMTVLGFEPLDSIVAVVKP